MRTLKSVYETRNTEQVWCAGSGPWMERCISEMSQNTTTCFGYRRVGLYTNGKEKGKQRNNQIREWRLQGYFGWLGNDWETVTGCGHSNRNTKMLLTLPSITQVERKKKNNSWTTAPPTSAAAATPTSAAATPTSTAATPTLFVDGGGQPPLHVEQPGGQNVKRPVAAKHYGPRYTHVSL